MIPRRDRHAVEQMVAASDLILQWVKGGRARFLADKMRQSAVERQLEVIGHHAGRISQGARDAHPEIPWRSMLAIGDLILHGKDSILPERLWAAATGPLKEALPRLEALVEHQ